MAKEINNPELLIKNIAKKLTRWLEAGVYITSETLGRQISKGSYYGQAHFWQQFTQAFNDRFSEHIFDSQAVFKALLDQDINPFHLDHLLAHKTFTRREKCARLIELTNPLADYSQQGAIKPLEYIRQWDALIGRALAFVPPYEMDQDVIPDEAFNPLQRFMACVLQAEHPTLFIHGSGRYQECLGAWVNWLASVEPKTRTEGCKQLIRTIADTGLKGNDEAIAAKGLMGPALMGAVKLLQQIDFSDGLNEGYLSPSFTKAIKLHFPLPDDRLSIAKELMALGIDEITEDALEALALDPEQAVEALSSIDHEEALRAFGEVLRKGIQGYGSMEISDMAKLIAVVETYRELFIHYAMGDIKGHSCLDNLCASLEAAEYFAEKGYIRQAPKVGFARFESTLYFSAIIGQRTSLGDGVLGAHKVDRVLDLLNKLGAIASLRPAVEAYFKNDAVNTSFMHREPFEHLIIRLIERRLVDVNDLVRTETRLKKLQAIGINATYLDGSKVFDKNIESFLARDLGL